jgi:hypothetical protein
MLRTAISRHNAIGATWHRNRPWRKRVLGRGAKRLSHGRAEFLLRQPHTFWRPTAYGAATVLLLLVAELIWPNNGRNNASSSLQTLLAVFGVATLAIFVSISLFQAPGEYVDLTALALANDPEREDLLRLIFYGLIVTLGQLIANTIWPGLVGYSVAFSGLLAVIVVIFLFGYVRTRLRLFTPRKLAEYLADQVERNQRRAMAPYPDEDLPRRKKIAGCQELVLRRFCDLGYLTHHELQAGRVEAAAIALDHIFALLVGQAEDRRYAGPKKVVAHVIIQKREDYDKLSEAAEWYSHIAEPPGSKIVPVDAIPHNLAQSVRALWLESAAKRIFLQLAADIRPLSGKRHHVAIFAGHWKSGFEEWEKACLAASKFSYSQDQPIYRWTNDLFTAIGIVCLAEKAKADSDGRLIGFGNPAEKVEQMRKMVEQSPLTRDELKKRAAESVEVSEDDLQAILDLEESEDVSQAILDNVRRTNLARKVSEHQAPILARKVSENQAPIVAFYGRRIDRLRARSKPRAERADWLVKRAIDRYIAQASLDRESGFINAAEAETVRKAANYALDKVLAPKGAGKWPPFWA